MHFPCVRSRALCPYATGARARASVTLNVSSGSSGSTIPLTTWVEVTVLKMGTGGVKALALKIGSLSRTLGGCRSPGFAYIRLVSLALRS